jgi:hypothetical protein
MSTLRARRKFPLAGLVSVDEVVIRQKGADWQMRGRGRTNRYILIVSPKVEINSHVLQSPKASSPTCSGNQLGRGGQLHMPKSAAHS